VLLYFSIRTGILLNFLYTGWAILIDPPKYLQKRHTKKISNKRCWGQWGSALLILIFRSIFKIIWWSKWFFKNGNPYFWHWIRKEREILRPKW